MTDQADEKQRLAMSKVGRNPFTSLSLSVLELISVFGWPLRVQSPEELEHWAREYPLHCLTIVLQLVYTSPKQQQAYASIFKKANTIRTVYIQVVSEAYLNVLAPLMGNDSVGRIVLHTKNSSLDQVVSIAQLCTKTKALLACNFQMSRFSPEAGEGSVQAMARAAMAKSLAECKEKLIYLETEYMPLCLTDTNLTSSGPLAFFGLKDLSMISCGLSFANLQPLLTFVKKRPLIVELDIYGNPLGDESMPLLAEFLKANTQLVRLNLQRVGLGDEGAIVLAKSLGHNKHLTAIFLSDAAFGDAGGVAFGEMLEINTALRLFFFEDAGFGDIAARSFIKALKVNKPLRELLFWNTAIGSDLTRQLKDAATKSKTLKYLCVGEENGPQVEKRPRESPHRWRFMFTEFDHNGIRYDD